MEPYIRMNTEFRKQAKNDFEKNFYKLMNNSVFGKTMENLRNRVDIKIVRSNEKDKIRKLVASPLYSRHVIFTNDLVGIDMRKSRLLLNKPVYTGMTILDNSKILMYDFYYNHLKKQYGKKCELLYTDTDSLLLEIETEDVYKDIKANEYHYDTIRLPEGAPAPLNREQKGSRQNERRVRRNSDIRGCVSEIKNVLGHDRRRKQKAYRKNKRRVPPNRNSRV